MNKKVKLLGLSIGIICVGLTSCQKENSNDGTDAAEDMITSTRGAEDISAEVLYSSTDCERDWTQIVGDCAVITESSTTFPKTVTIDFGDGCVDFHGKTRTGKIIIIISDDIHNEGATRDISFENFSIEGMEITGYKNATNIGLSSSGFVLIKETGEVSVTKDDLTRTKTYEHLREWIRGSETCEKEDDEFLITGEGTMTGGKCKGTGTHKIITPLHLAPGSCEYILSGSIEFEKGKRRSGTIDFGNGSCDNVATLTTKKGKVIEIDLDKRRLMGH